MKYTRPSGLEGFHLEKYSILSTFSPDQWIPLIESRLHLGSIIDKLGIRPTNTEIAPNPFRDYAKAELDCLIAAPLVPFGHGFLKRFSERSRQKSTVEAVKAIDVVHFYNAVLEVREHIRDAPLTPGDAASDAQFTADNYEAPIDELLAKSRYYNLDNFANFRVDLSADDATLREDFKAAIAAARKRLKKGIPSTTISRVALWCSNKVLPYADLMLWSKLTGIKLTDSDLRNLLFEGDDAKIFEADDPLFGTKRDFKDAISPLILRRLKSYSATSTSKK
ncbi:DUF6387 family protein [Massilia aquatica]|uniref:Uncharacterized protein n=1 Tax=Massilia aquatica TaxID=2609000 RepID=A0ABX0M204_9BURK|nr:DUF6387 family protein [Massilia aquatica]NHZ38565.1 hypothetical protein [Massilia aquatica]